MHSSLRATPHTPWALVYRAAACRVTRKDRTRLFRPGKAGLARLYSRHYPLLTACLHAFHAQWSWTRSTHTAGHGCKSVGSRACTSCAACAVMPLHHVAVLSVSVTADAPPSAAACTQAAARQTQFEKTPVGRAAYAAVKDAKKPVAATGGQDNAKDWIS